MFLNLIVAGMECALMTLEDTNVIAMRVQIISKGDERGQREAELMVSEKVAAFSQAGADMMTGASNAAIRNNMRLIVQANEGRLNALLR